MLTIKNGRTVWVLPAMVVVGMMLLSACGAQTTPAAVTDPTAIPVQESTQTSIVDAPTGAVEPTDAPAATDAPAPTDAAGGNPVSFKNDVLPILQSRCIKCHGGEKTEHKLDVTTYDHLMAGAEKGPVVVVGDAATSKLFLLVEQGKMPKRSAKLLPAQIQILMDWINQGALNN